ncbi:hypothetical protein PCANC_13562 [Puccinia coronata f. sp. avenae]|uniref:Uncharacterized protein n=1 Tax=Puccinia coronata f. sp. avenae TaxID=200324 RepID=A0A2N5UCQ8_9BASI|nr:hypothetical protein PCASD_11238 [Puccinia coronata f. sp. avenae]PLW35522.1 hypothetical protein PCANC_13562 [Puccinia coronata f. sp. avenae]
MASSRVPPPSATATASRINPAASTSSSTLVNELEDAQQQEQELIKQRQSFQDTSHLHIFEFGGDIKRIHIQQPTSSATEHADSDSDNPADDHPTTQQQQPTKTQPQPRKTQRDQRLYNKLISSPQKLLARGRSLSTLAQQSSTQKLSLESTMPIKQDLINRLSSEDDTDDQQQRSSLESDQDDTFHMQPNDGTVRLNSIFENVLAADSILITNNAKTQQTSSSSSSSSSLLRDSRPVEPRPSAALPSEPKPRPRPPFGHLRGAGVVFNKAAPPQDTRQIPSETPTNKPIHRAQNVQPSSSHAAPPKTSARANHPLAHPITDHSQHTSSSSSATAAAANNGWRDHPIITAKTSTSDTDSPEDAFKLHNKSITQDQHHHQPRDRTKPPPKPTLPRSLDQQKKVTFNDQKLLESHGTATFGGFQSRHTPGSDSTDTDEELAATNHIISANPALDHSEAEDHTAITSAGQTTLATPKIAGFYPHTPATLRPPQSRLAAADEDRRLEKLKNQQPSKPRMKRVSSTLEDEPSASKPLINDQPPKTTDVPPPPTSHVSSKTTDPSTVHARSNKGKEKEGVEARPGQSVLAHPGSKSTSTNEATTERIVGSSSSRFSGAGAAAEAHGEPLDQTVMMHANEMTRGSCFPTPHPPGWFPGTPGQGEAGGSSGRLTARRTVRSVTAVKQQARRAGHLVDPSRRAGDRVIFASTTAPHGYSVDDDGTDDRDATPRPAKRPAHRTTSTTTVPFTTAPPHAQHPDFSSPSFDGFDDARRKFLLTSTPATAIPTPAHAHHPPHIPNPDPNPPPAPDTTPPAANTLKHLAAAVIEFIVDKNPIEVLADTFSRNNEKRLDKTEIAHRRREQMQQKGSQTELDALLRSADQVERERARIQAQLTQLQQSPRRPSRVLGFLKRWLFLAGPSRPSSSSEEEHKLNKPSHHHHPSPAPSYSRTWKRFLIGMLVQTMILWMGFQLSTVRSYHSMVQAVDGEPGMAAGPFLCYMSRARLRRMKILTTTMTTPTTVAGNGTRGVLDAGRRGGQEQEPLWDGVQELARFVADWAAGFACVRAPHASHHGAFRSPIPVPPPPPPPPSSLLARILSAPIQRFLRLLASPLAHSPPPSSSSSSSQAPADPPLSGLPFLDPHLQLFVPT